MLFLMVCNVQAGTRNSGIIEDIDLENGLVQINNMNYKLQEGKTRLISGEHKLNLRLLERGSRVDFVIENSLVTEIRLKTPYVFRY